MTDSIQIDRKYIGFVSNRLRNFQNKNRSGGGAIASFTHDCERNDSRKRRGYFLEYKGSAVFVCHNCGARSSFQNFLKDLDGNLAKDYTMDCFRDGVFGDYKEPIAPMKVPTIILEKKADDSPYFRGLISFKTLLPSNPARIAISRRKIPDAKLDTLYLVKNFYKWAALIEPIFKKFPQNLEHPRLIIPYFDIEKKLLGFSCRAFGKEEPKYIQLRLDKEKEFLYGLDTLDVEKRILVVEGQIDSMFLNNCIAVGNANYGGEFIREHKDNITIVPDNDFRRNPDVCAQLEKAIKKGFSVCLLPERWKKDINDIVKSGVPADTIENYIAENTKQGLSAQLELTLERRC